MDTCTSLVEMRSIDSRHLSRVEKILAKKPCDRDRLLECTLITRMLCLTVTAVGLLGRLRSACIDVALLARKSFEGSPARASSISAGLSGKMTVPFPRGFATFFILMGIRARIACSIVNG